MLLLRKVISPFHLCTPLSPEARYQFILSLMTSYNRSETFLLSEPLSNEMLNKEPEYVIGLWSPVECECAGDAFIFKGSKR